MNGVRYPIYADYGKGENESEILVHILATIEDITNAIGNAIDSSY